MPTTVTYRDRTFANAARLAWILALVGVLVFALRMAGVLDIPVLAPVLFAAVCALVSFFYRTAVPVEVEIGPDGIVERQGLGLGWRVSWDSVTDLTLVKGRDPVVAVVSSDLRARRMLDDRRLNGAGIPRNARSLPATAEAVAAIAAFAGRSPSGA